MEQVLALMIPIIALLIPLTVVVGKVIVAPLAKALGDSESGSGPELREAVGARLAAIEARIDGIEDAMHRVLETEDFYRKLAAAPRPSGGGGTEGRTGDGDRNG